MKLPWVTRERLEYERSIWSERLHEASLREARLMNMIETLTKTGSPSTEESENAIRREPSFALPPDVIAAIRSRASRGSPLEAQLRTFAREQLANGEADPEAVATAILQGDRSFSSDDEPW